MDAFKQSDKMF